MSAAVDGKRTVTFKASNGKKTKKTMQQTVAPNQITLAGGKDGADRTQEKLDATPLRKRDEVDEQFPTAALAMPQEEDALMAEKLELQDEARPGVTVFGQLTAKDSDFLWLRGKREQEAEALFQQWFATNFDHMSPEQKAMARELWPEFYAQRIQLLKKQVALQERIAKLKILGIQDREDVLLQYAIEAGYIDSDPLEHILHPERARNAQDAVERQKRFQRGLLNPRRLPRGDWGTQARGLNAKDLTGRAAGPASWAGTTHDGKDVPFSAIGFNKDETKPNYDGTRQLLGL
jgi:hypothetical protein